jgi:hypothetical protein
MGFETGDRFANERAIRKLVVALSTVGGAFGIGTLLNEFFGLTEPVAFGIGVVTGVALGVLLGELAVVVGRKIWPPDEDAA